MLQVLIHVLVYKVISHFSISELISLTLSNYKKTTSDENNHKYTELVYLYLRYILITC